MSSSILKKVKHLTPNDHVIGFGKVEGTGDIQYFGNAGLIAVSFDDCDPCIWEAEEMLHVKGDGTLQGQGYTDRLQLRVERSTEATDLVWLGIRRSGNLEQGIHVRLEELRRIVNAHELPEPK